jgi:hypothetical protein
MTLVLINILFPDKLAGPWQEVAWQGSSLLQVSELERLATQSPCRLRSTDCRTRRPPSGEAVTAACFERRVQEQRLNWVMIATVKAAFKLASVTMRLRDTKPFLGMPQTLFQMVVIYHSKTTFLAQGT